MNCTEQQCTDLHYINFFMFYKRKLYGIVFAFTVLHNILYYTLYCPAHYTALHTILYCTLYCPAHYTVLHTILPCTLYCTAHYTVLHTVLQWTRSEELLVSVTVTSGLSWKMRITGAS